MAETDNANPTTDEQQGEQAAEEKQYSGQKIMCYVSKKMVPIEDTVELEYAPGKAVRVLPRYIKYGNG